MSASLQRKFFVLAFALLFGMRPGMQIGCLDFHKLPLTLFP